MRDSRPRPLRPAGRPLSFAARTLSRCKAQRGALCRPRTVAFNGLRSVLQAAGLGSASASASEAVMPEEAFRSAGALAVVHLLRPRSRDCGTWCRAAMRMGCGAGRCGVMGLVRWSRRLIIILKR